jgi:hypothetical protein
VCLPWQQWTEMFACHGSSGQKSQYDLMTLAYQHFTAVLLLIYGSLFLSGIYYCLNAFWCAVTRTSKFLVKLVKSGSEIREMLAQVYRNNAMKKTAIYKWVTHFSKGRASVTDEERSGRSPTSVKLCVKIVGRLSGA